MCYNKNKKSNKCTRIKNNKGGLPIYTDNIIKVNFLHEQEPPAPLFGLIAPAEGDVETNQIKEHSADPIKSLDDIDRISDYLIENKRYRDNMLFIVGINFGLRVSDLLTLRFSHLITDEFRYRPYFKLLEKKTANTRTRKKNRCISINKAVREAISLYLVNTPDVKLSDYMFRSLSNNSYSQNKPIHRNSVEKMLKGIGNDLGLPYHMSTHALRKTFGYHQMAMANNDPRKLLLLQKMFGHSTSAQTLDYIGLTNEEMADAYMAMNLGLREKTRVDSELVEEQQGISA